MRQHQQQQDEEDPAGQQRRHPGFDAVRIPPLERQLGARVEHLVLQAEGLLSRALSNELSLPAPLLRELMRFGAVYYCPVMPKPNDKAPMSEAQLQAAADAREAAMKAWGRSPKLQVPRRVLQDQHATLGGYARVHLHPKRFPTVVDWRARILHEGPDCVIVDKPPGVQVSPTVDNLLESVPACAAAALGLPPASLHGLHRLDAGTSGVVVCGKGDLGFTHWFCGLLGEKGAVGEGGGGGSEGEGKGGGGGARRRKGRKGRNQEEAAAAAAAELQAEGEAEAAGGAAEAATVADAGGAAGASAAEASGAEPDISAAAAAAGGDAAGPPPHERVRKVYRVATLAPPPLGRLTHHARVAQRAAGEPPHTLMLREAAEGTAVCILEVISVARIALAGPAAAAHGPRAFEAEVRLVTGRTHQIRAQMAAEGCPVLGDLLYAAVMRRQRQQQGEGSEEQQRQQQQQGDQGQPGNGGGGGGGESAAAAGVEGGPFAVGGDAAAWSRAAQADPLRPIGLQAARLAVYDPEGRLGAGTTHARGGGWVEFAAGTPWWRADDGSDGPL
ncbi:MAG: hypothetical protein J3K34DRAFT_518978 [Monoraphidium minutum]|nr:MAG: hypothetical protein J3K34DRAFT_518978 [Monoraphidium minutum]